MKQLNSDFSKAKVGDPVYHLDGRIGRIDSIRPSLVFPIIVRWDSHNATTNYMFDGKNTLAIANIFTHPIKIIHADDEPFVERVMEVSADEKKWYKRVVCIKKNGSVYAWNDAETIEQAKNKNIVVYWSFYREIQPVNPRIAEIENLMQELQNELESLKEVNYEK